MLTLVSNLVVFGDRVVAFGVFDRAGTLPARGIASWDGKRWRALDSGLVNEAWSGGLASFRGDLYVGGQFTQAGGQPAGNWARWGCACYADCDGDGVLTAADFSCFQTRFALGNAYADCNGDGVLGLADFGCFQTKFALGCP
jgi:hypothetical protein